MNRFLVTGLCAFVMFYHVVVCVAQDDTLLAEGDDVALTKSGPRTLSHWKLWHLNDGTYRVADLSVQNVSAIQEFRFDSKFMPVGFSKKAGPVGSPDSRFPTSTGFDISCDYKPKELTCETVSRDRAKTTQTVAAIPPYVVAGEFYDLDFIWFMTGVVHLASEGNASSGFVNIYGLTTTGNNPMKIALKPDKPVQIVSCGDESAMELGRTQRIKKYKIGTNGGRVLVGTDQGMISRINLVSNPNIGFAITNYKEYKPWGVPFGDIRNVAASNAISEQSEISGPVQVPSGLMSGLLIHKVQPEYPAAAKLNKIQGKVLLHAIINTEGKVVELSLISGPQELVSSAMEAVKQWQYRPYISHGQPMQADTQIAVNFKLPK